MTAPDARLIPIEKYEPHYLRFRRRALAAGAAWSAVTVALAASLGLAGLALGLAGWGLLGMAGLLWAFHRLQIEQVHHYRQIEALFSLHALVTITQPLPPMRLWAASPDFLLLAVGLIRREKPRFVLELGSGVSTLVCAYALQDSGGRMLSLDHEAAFGQTTIDNLRDHGLSEVAEVAHAPLARVTIGAVDWQWYDTAAIGALPQIDLLIVDGPPEATQPLARYPALPLLFGHLRAGALVLVDDFARHDETEMVSRWIAEYGLVVERAAGVEKGAVILRKPGGAG
jgi:predicted O-methyltransferase YrrM